MFPAVAALLLGPQTVAKHDAQWFVIESQLVGVQALLEDVAGPDGPRGDAEVQESYRVERLDQEGMTLVRYRREVRLISALEEDRTWTVRWADLRGATLDREPAVNGAIRAGLRFAKPLVAQVVERRRLGALPQTPNYSPVISDRSYTDGDEFLPITFGKREEARIFLTAVRRLADAMRLTLPPPAVSGPTLGTGF